VLAVPPASAHRRAPGHRAGDTGVHLTRSGLHVTWPGWRSPRYGPLT